MPKININKSKKIKIILGVLALFCFFTPSVFSASDSVDITQTITAESSPVLPGGGGGTAPIDATPPIISEITVFNITSYSAEISWVTDTASTAELDYGKTESYEIGTKKDHLLSLLFFHRIKLSGLEEGTKYHLKIRSKDSNGNEAKETGYSFITLSLIRDPSNINSFTAEAVEGKIILNWKNPLDINFAGVQINKNIDFPALNINGGEIIYSGMSEGFDDLNVENGIKYFYTAFSYNDSENFSSGVIAFATGIKTGKPKPSKPPEHPKPPEPLMSPEPPIITPSDIENLETVSNSEDKKIIIKWDNPDDVNFKEVEIYKSEDFPVLIPGSGELIYQGQESNFEDKNTEENVIYYYSVFIKDKNGNYSSGKTVTGTLEEMPISPISEISLKDVSFIAYDKALLLPKYENNKIYVFTGSEFGVYYDTKNLPKTLKTILITVNESSYILSLDEQKSFYKTKLVAPAIAGNYPMTISVLDFKHGKIYQTKAEMGVVSYGVVYELKIKDYESKSFLGKIVSSIKYQVSSIFNKKEFLDLGKAGINGAKIILYKFDKNNNDWQLWESEKYRQENSNLTSKNGEYEFMVPNGKYKITIKKEGYHNYSEIIDVEHNVINSKIEIRGKADWRWAGLVLVLLVFGVVYVGWSKWKRRKKQI